MSGHRPRAALVMEEASRDAVYPPALIARIDAVADLRRPFLTAEEFRRDARAAAETEILLTGWGAPVLDAAALGRAPRLRAVFHAAGTVKGFVHDAVFDRGIAVVNAAAANAEPVAEFAVAQILLAARGFWHAQREYRAQHLATTSSFARGTRDSTVGLVALGEIGRRVAERLRAHPVHVLVHDPGVDDARLRALGAEPAGLDRLFRESQVVSVHAPLLASTRGLVTETLLRSLPRGAVLVNTARGAVVDEDALIDVLTDRTDLTALLDVTRHEPIRPGSALWGLPNVELSPHIAGATGADRESLGELVVGELERYLGGAELRHRIEPTTLDRSA
ncbi:hydroxyacid dehydrogenase [Promicromonospora sp. NPDC059942]|uniref:hydroxyacid dehydrogenase n=1 Tax=Promicromonospora sp. NPDC059942 TaxID=3347009 RepID=UPI00365D2755